MQWNRPHGPLLNIEAIFPGMRVYPSYMMTSSNGNIFPRYWPFARGIHRSSVNSPHKGQWRGALMFSMICAWINDWVNNREAGDLRRHRAHYDVIVMEPEIICLRARLEIFLPRSNNIMAMKYTGVVCILFSCGYIISSYCNPTMRFSMSV